MYINVKCIFICLLFELYCFAFSQLYEHRRYKRFIEKTTTAEPRLDLLKNNDSTTNTNITQNLSTTVTPKIMKNFDTTTPIYFKNTTDKFNNSQYTQLSTTKSDHKLFMTTATPTIVFESTATTASERQFDVLSFLGGCLCTVSLTGIGLFGWKMYSLHLERSYRTI